MNGQVAVPAASVDIINYLVFQGPAKSRNPRNPIFGSD